LLNSSNKEEEEPASGVAPIISSASMSISTCIKGKSQLKAQGPSRTCNKSKEEEEEREKVAARPLLVWG